MDALDRVALVVTMVSMGRGPLNGGWETNGDRELKPPEGGAEGGHGQWTREQSLAGAGSVQ